MGVRATVTECCGIADGETGFDRVMAFTIPDRHARGRIVRLGPLIDTILSAHDYPTAVRHLLAEALTLTALIGSLLKEPDAQLTLQGRANGGIVDLLVCDYREGALRGYVQHDPTRLSALPTFPSLGDLFGGGYLAVTFDSAVAGKRYQGIVPLEAGTLTGACEGYFGQSEQVPTLIRTSVRWDGRGCVAGGLLIQHLPEADVTSRLHADLDHPEWQHVSALAGSVRAEELADAALSLEALTWRLFHEERQVRVEPLPLLSRGCRCTGDYYNALLRRFPEEDLMTMRGEDGLVSVDCAFCSRVFRIDV